MKANNNLLPETMGARKSDRVARFLFYLFEASFVGSVVALDLVVRRSGRTAEGAGAIAMAAAFWASAIGLLTVSFLLRRSARPLAILGWWTLFGALVYEMATPRL